MTDTEAGSRPATWRLAAAFVIGGAAPLSGFAFGMPGNGEFVPIVWLAGFLALLIAPGWAGFAALIAGVAISAAVLDVSDGTSGLVVLVVAIVSALAAHGALTASVVRRLSNLGWRRGVRDEFVRVGGGTALVLALVFIWFATELARNPA